VNKRLLFLKTERKMKKQNLGWSAMEIAIVNGATQTKLRNSYTFRKVVSGRKITDLVAESMGHNSQNASKIIGINDEALRLIRKLVVISRRHIEAEDRIKLEHCLETLNRERSLVNIRLMCKQLVSKYWLSKKPRKEKRAMDIKIFERALFALHEICETAAELEIPFDYSVDQVRAARTKVDSAKRALAELRKKLEGRKQATENSHAS
jgi:hypothetical protein